MNQAIPITFPDGITLTIKREDRLHPYISGNKFRKLKYNIEAAINQGKNTLLTFGGAYSNHIAATAAAGKKYNLTSIGIIRGDELSDQLHNNPTLAFATGCGMLLKFVSREAYRQKTDKSFIKALHDEFGDFYLIPEGGTNTAAVKGCEEIITPQDKDFTHIACAVGTGGTISGLVNSALAYQEVLGFPVLKGQGLLDDICKFARQDNWKLITDYHFGGYAKVTEGLVNFINGFYAQTGIPLDPVYTGKALFGVIDLINKKYFPANARILFIHTGGLQGILGMNRELQRKGIPLIKT